MYADFKNRAFADPQEDVDDEKVFAVHILIYIDMLMLKRKFLLWKS